MPRYRSTIAVLLFCHALVGCSLTSDAENECSALDSSPLVADTTSVVGQWNLDHYRSFGWGNGCAIQRTGNEELRRSLDFRDDGTYTETAGGEAREGSYEFRPDDGNLYRLVLDSSLTPVVRLTPDTLVLDYRAVDGGQFVYLKD